MEQSEPIMYDMGISTLQRINFELWHCNTARRERRLDLWWFSLLNIYIETETFMDGTEKKAHNEMYQEGNKIYEKMSNPEMLIQKKDYNHLIQWELNLRNSMDKHGLLMKKGEDAGSAIIRT